MDVALIFGISTVVAVSSFFLLLKREHSPPLIGGWVAPGFDGVKEAFETNFRTGWDSKGAAFTVFKDGVMVVNLHGGYANEATLHKWEADTLASIFSCGKGIVAIAIAMLYERGHLKYDALVKDYWPEFGSHGKDNITVAMLLSHQGGLERMQFDTTLDDIGDHKKMSKLLSDMIPSWPPGTAQGYHTYTYGWLADQLIRRVDPEHRSASQFIKEELADPLGADFFIGLPKGEFHRKAYAYKPGLIEFLYALKAFFLPLLSFLMKVSTKSKLPPELVNVEAYTNNPQLLTLEIPAANGVASSQGLARIWSLIANDGVDALTGKRFLSSKAIDQLFTVRTDRLDRTIQLPIAFGPGVRVHSGAFHSVDGDEVTTCGHSGFGGQYAHADRDRKISVAYLTNKLHLFLANDPRFMTLVQAVYDSPGLKNT